MSLLFAFWIFLGLSEGPNPVGLSEGADPIAITEGVDPWSASK